MHWRDKAFYDCDYLRTVVISRKVVFGFNAFPNDVQINYSD